MYPAKHFVTTEDRIERAIAVIREELRQQLEKFQAEGKLLEAQRLSARTRFDLEMLQEVGHCRVWKTTRAHSRANRLVPRPIRCTISSPMIFC